MLKKHIAQRNANTMAVSRFVWNLAFIVNEIPMPTCMLIFCESRDQWNENSLVTTCAYE
jgi:hypothetical protein